MTVMKTALDNFWKRENALTVIFFIFHYDYNLPRVDFVILVNFNLPSADAFNLYLSKIVLFSRVF